MTKTRATRPVEDDMIDATRVSNDIRDFASEAEERLPLPERLAEQIAVAIQAGRIPAGQPVREQDLSAMFGVSRGPVREALRILEGDGFVELEPYRGAVVTRASEHDVAVAVEIQVALFGVAARTVAKYATEAEIEELAQSIADLEAMEGDDSATPEEFAKMGLRITWLLIHLAHSTSLAKSIRSVRRLTHPERWSYAMASKAKRRRAVRQWNSILDAIRSRNPGRSETLAKARARQIHSSTTTKG